VNRPLIRIVVIAAFAVAAVGAIRGLRKADPSVASAFGFDDAGVSDMIAALETGEEDPARFAASVDGALLTLSADGESETFALPEGSFYLSVAPT